VDVSERQSPSVGVARRLRDEWALILVAVLGLGVRLVLLPTVGLRDDTDLFAGWVHGLANGQLSDAYRLGINFPPVMVYVLWLVGQVQPAFQTATDAADAAVRAAIKTPASLADVGLAAGVCWYLRDRRGWATIGAATVLLHPAIIDVSSWWGQFESIYVLGGLLAFLFAAAGRPRLAAVALGLALMTKPQALPFAIPFAAWYVGRHGWRETAICAAIGAATVGLVWLPFLADDGVSRFLATLDQHQNGEFAVLSLRAWNPWWILQSGAGGDFLSDRGALVGPLSPRTIGLLLFAALEVGIFVAVLRRPDSRTLALGIAASVMAAFVALTTMHERYAYASVVFLALLLPERQTRWLWAVLSVTFTANLLAAIPPPLSWGAIPIGGPVGLIGSVAMLSVAAGCLMLLAEAVRRPAEASPAVVTPAPRVARHGSE
jgi:Gpi18-like mannosyltransferase